MLKSETLFYKNRVNGNFVACRKLRGRYLGPEHDVIDCFMILMADFPQSAMEVAEYFEETYIGRRLPDQTRRLPPFPVRFWSMYTRVLNQTARTNNSVEGGITRFNLAYLLHILVFQN